MRVWHRRSIIALLFILVVGSLASCTNDAPVSPGQSHNGLLSEAVAPAQLVFLNRTYDDENNQTTFEYQLQATAPSSGPLSGILGIFTDITVELPTCAPTLDGFAPPNGATVGETILGFNGITWGVGYDVNPDFEYSITYPGDVAAGTVRSIITTGGFTYIGTTTGAACEGDNQVAGTVYTDANGNGVMDANEFGVPDVTVELSDGVATYNARTDADGNYVFLVVEGTYTLSVDSLTTDNTDFNETLFQYWDATTSISREVTVGPDSIDNDFGFEPAIDDIIGQLDAGNLVSEGKSYKWWRKEFLRTMEGNRNTAYTEAQLLAFAQAIEDLALLDEYDWTPGQELEQIYAILNNHFFEEDNDNVGEVGLGTKGDQGRHSAYHYLLRELLTWELNVVSGRALNNPILEEVLVNWGEGVLDNNTPAALPTNLNVVGDIPPGEEPRAITNPLEEGGKLFTRLNGATGGGGTGN